MRFVLELGRDENGRAGVTDHEVGNASTGQAGEYRVVVEDRAGKSAVTMTFRSPGLNRTDEVAFHPELKLVVVLA